MVADGRFYVVFGGAIVLSFVAIVAMLGLCFFLHVTQIHPFARECRLGVWFGFVGAALLPAVGTCVVLAFGAMPGQAMVGDALSV